MSQEADIIITQVDNGYMVTCRIPLTKDGPVKMPSLAEVITGRVNPRSEYRGLVFMRTEHLANFVTNYYADLKTAKDSAAAEGR